jgi:ADP-ribose pyrophosphatase YjhB (NUDIX family)
MIAGPIKFCPRCSTALTEQLHSGKLRPVCPSCNWVYFPDPKVAVVVLIKKDDQVLFVQRMFDPQKGYWTLPSGFVDAGEDPKLAAQRECLEETGFNIHNIKLLDLIHSQEYPRGASILIVYQAQVQSGELKPGDDARQVAYFRINNLPPLAFASTQHILNLYI